MDPRLALGMIFLLLGLDLDITGWSVEAVGQSGCQEERYYLCFHVPCSEGWPLSGEETASRRSCIARQLIIGLPFASRRPFLSRLSF